ncbi:MAG: 4-hydroxythreonine-4-phosphate dehydrogenase PdxA [Planctomycetota bacterium]
MRVPTLALTLGDPSGIGREITVPAARAACADGARILVLGPAELAPDDVPRVESVDELGDGPGVAWRATRSPDPGYALGEVSATAGAAALDALRVGHELALSRSVDALVTGPVNKAALWAAGERVEGQTELLGRWADAPDVQMIGLAGPLRVLLATRHMPLKDAIASLTEELVLDRVVLFHEALQSIGIARPRIAVAGLNPHAGEGGLLGAEDGAILEPAVAAARRRGIDATGPVSPDTVFAHGAEGRSDGVLALYHDQAFIPLKLCAQGRGVTLLAGMPYSRFSPMHGTAFDIVGRASEDGRPLADPGNLVEALKIASRLGAPEPE